MSEPNHIQGPVLSVPCDDDGHVYCLACQKAMQPTSAYILMRRPTDDLWLPICRYCARDLAQRIQISFAADTLADVLFQQ